MTDSTIDALARALFLSRSHEANDPLWAGLPTTYVGIAESVIAALTASGWTLAPAHTITPECGPICWTTGHHHDVEACDGCRRLADTMHAASMALAQPAPDPLWEAAQAGTIMAVAAEVGRARGLFPKPDGLLAALVEEVGEVARALLSESDERVREECIQVAAMACRLAEESDPTLAALRAALASKGGE